MADNFSTSPDGKKIRKTGKGAGNKTSVKTPVKPKTSVDQVQIPGKDKTNNNEDITNENKTLVYSYKVEVNLEFSAYDSIDPDTYSEGLVCEFSNTVDQPEPELLEYYCDGVDYISSISIETVGGVLATFSGQVKATTEEEATTEIRKIFKNMETWYETVPNSYIGIASYDEAIKIETLSILEQEGNPNE